MFEDEKKKNQRINKTTNSTINLSMIVPKKEALEKKFYS